MSVDEVIKSGGGVTALARAIGVTPPSILGWKRRELIPANRVVAVERETGIPREQLRPDLYRDSLGSTE